MTLEVKYNRKVDFDYIELDDVRCIYPLNDRDKPNKKEYVVITKEEYMRLSEAKRILDESLEQKSFEF